MFVLWVMSVSTALVLFCIMLVVLEYLPLGSFVCVVDLSYEACPFIFVFVTNKVLICSTHVLYYVVVAFSDCSQMAPSSPKKKTPAKKADKRMKMDPNLFRFVSHFERYKDFFLKAGIIQERFVDLEDLRDTFIPSCFEGRGWEKLLCDLLVVCEPLIREFYSNAVIREDELSYWVRGKEFTLDAHDIDDMLGLKGLEDQEFVNYKDRILSIETV